MRKRASEIVEKIVALGHPAAAEQAQRFFKTGRGQYGEGDRFLGIRVPVLRAHIREFRDLPLEVGVDLLQSPLHEIRLLVLLIWVAQFERARQTPERTRLFKAYWANRNRVNNWDLVDLSAPQIVGGYFFDRDRQPLYRLVRSRRLWDRRIAILATFHFIRNGEFDDTLALAEHLLGDPEDLMHKAVGWMLREVGKRDLPKLEAFLQRHAPRMPRTMLRYAIERFPEAVRQSYLLLPRELR